jgi:hypothetical protein
VEVRCGKVRLKGCAETRLRILLLISRELRRNNRIKRNTKSNNSIKDMLQQKETLGICKAQREAQLMESSMKNQFASRGRRAGPKRGCDMTDVAPLPPQREGLSECHKFKMRCGSL